MARMREEIKRLMEERARLDAQIQDLEHKLHGLKGERAGFDRALKMLGGQESAADQPIRKERARGVKETVLAAVQNAGSAGLTVSQLLERTEREGVHLERGTVSSLLSRFKREQILDMEDGKYFVPSREKSEEELRREILN